MAGAKYAGLRAGQLRDRVDIQERIDQLDAAGAPLPAQWRTVLRAWADVQTETSNRRSSETVRADQLMAQAIYRIVIRFNGRIAITEKHRALWIGPPDIPLNIIAIPQDPDGRRRQLVLICQQGLVDG